MSTYTINVSFQTRVNKTTRTLEIAESFGLGLDEKDWTLYDNLELEVEQGDVVYITGQSGSGKSVLLRELSAQMTAAGLNVADIDKVELKPIPLIDQIGKNTGEALNFLSLAGLNDAYLFIRKPSELSDGQRYRFRLAKVIESGAQVQVQHVRRAINDGGVHHRAAPRGARLPRRRMKRIRWCSVPCAKSATTRVVR